MIVANSSSDKNDNTKPPLTLTVSHIDPNVQSQQEIDAAVKSSVHNGISLYNLNDTALTDSKPTVILTQSLCDVCAVAKDEVDTEVMCNFTPGQCKVISLEPETLTEVVDTFVTVADICGVRERGVELHQQFWEDVKKISHATSLSTRSESKKPSVLFMEWLNPPFDAGHWICDMLDHSATKSALPSTKNTRKSIQLTWEQIYVSDPDVIMIGCCGFDRKRNEADARASIKKLEPLRAYKNNRIYASDGNLFFARPGPGLREGVAILARCAYDGEVNVVKALEQLPFMPKENVGWSKIDFNKEEEQSSEIPDIEDAHFYAKLHEEACLAKKDFYIDPNTSYSVYTEFAIKKRGKCCGSGCRHCPYNHENLKDKTKIQQPCFIYDGDEEGGSTIFAPLSSIPPQSHVKVLFFSGGKDSFLTIRTLVKERQTAPTPFHLILLTTFDADSKVVAHQEISINDIIKQAKHLKIPLLGIPLRRGSGETYLSRIEMGLDAVRRQVKDIQQIKLVFGDLHLEHIRSWRDKELSLYSLEYPLWNVPYEELISDLEASKVPIVLSAITVDNDMLKKGVTFDRQLMNDVASLGMDGFGEEGEFHSIAKVWAVSREQALGLYK